MQVLYNEKEETLVVTVVEGLKDLGIDYEDLANIESDLFPGTYGVKQITDNEKWGTGI